MKKRYFRIKNLHEYSKKRSENWRFYKFSENVYYLQNKKTGKIIKLRKTSKDKLDIREAFATCYYRIMKYGESMNRD